MTKLRGYLALTVVCLALLVLDPLQRLLIAPWARIRPQRRIAVFTRWQRLMARIVLGSVGSIGGASLPPIPRIRGGEGVLVLMNHQSVLDIPIVVAALEDSYPRIITRKRYVRWIPLISHMVRLYQYPVVDPRANSTETKKMLGSIRRAAKNSDVPLALFPEGTRTRDGEVGQFRPTGLKLILKQRAWTVYVLVVDGFWQRAKLRDFLGGMGDIRGSLALHGPFEWEDPRGDPDAFSEEMRRVMTESLAEMRREETG